MLITSQMKWATPTKKWKIQRVSHYILWSSHCLICLICNVIVDEVPPLEDMSEYFKSTQSGSSTSKPAKVKTDSSLLQLESDMPPLHSDLLIVKDKETKQVPSQPVPSSGSGGHSGSGNFGGMKKGFLGAPSNKKSKTSATPSQGKGLSKSQEPSKGKMPYLKGNTKSSEKNLKFDEVQDEMNKSVPLLSSKGKKFILTVTHNLK